MRKGNKLFSASVVFVMVFSGLLISIDLPEGIIPLELTVNVSASFAGGNGSASNPYQISNVSQLQNISSDLDAHYILINDINASATKSWNHGFEPIGEFMDPFMGSLDGRGFNITNLWISRTDTYYVGLFYSVGEDSVVRNVNEIDSFIIGGRYSGGIAGSSSGIIRNCSFNGTLTGYGFESQNFGGIVGVNNGFIENCSTNGYVKGIRNVGGIAGINKDIISNCLAAGVVKGDDNNIGGIVGSNENGDLFDCYTNAGVSGLTRVGGLIGNNEDSVVKHCSATSSVSGGQDNIGGLVGYNDNSYIEYCNASCEVGGGRRAGGLVGSNYDRTLSHCIFYGNLNGDDCLGGFIGYNKRGSIYDCKAAEEVIGSDRIGGFIGENYEGNIINCTYMGNISGTFDYEGGLIGNDRGGEIINCSSYGNISGNNKVGGLIGRTFGDVFRPGRILNSHFFGNITGNDNIGGLVGEKNEYTSIKNCSSISDITGKNIVGGLVGKNTGVTYSFSTIINSNAIGNISGIDRIGGIVGFNEYGIVSGCNYQGNITGDDFVGGVAGECLDELENCFSKGTVYGNNYVGGLTGYNEGNIEKCYADSIFDGNWSIGGLVGRNNGTVLNSFYNISAVNGINRVVTRYGIYDEQFNDWLNNDMSLKIDEYLEIDPESRSYEIGDLEDLKSFLPFAHEDHNIILTNDIDLSEEPGFNIPFFSGSIFEGSNRTVSNINMTLFNDDGFGFFSVVDSDSQIKNIILKNINITGFKSVGGLAGTNFGSVDNCRVWGDIYGESSVGGLIGEHIGGDLKEGYVKCSRSSGIVRGEYWNIGGLIGFSNGYVENCYSSSDVRGGDEDLGSFYNTGLGGLIGNSNENVKNCIATGNVYGKYFTDVGGLIGSCYRYVTNSISIGNVYGPEYLSDIGGLIGGGGGTVTGCFWDIQTSGQTSSDGGTGKNTSELKEKILYSNAGWDINNTWDIIDGESYPFLRCFDYNGEIDINTVDKTEVFEDSLYFNDYDAISSLPGGFGAFWTFDTNAGGWLNIKEDGNISGIPKNDDVGIYWVNVSATTNGIDHDYSNFTLRVINTNDNPVIKTTSLPDINEDTGFYMIIDVFDIDPSNDELDWSIETNSDFLSIDHETGNLSGTPSNDDVGEWWVLVNVSDGNGGFDKRNFTIVVMNVNDDPEILEIEIPEVLEDELFYLDPDAIDIDPTIDTLYWSLKTDASFLSIDPSTGNLSGIPTNNDVGEWWVNLTVSDENGGEDWINFTLTVVNVNDRPELNLTELTLTFDEDSLGIEYDLNDLFFDVDGDHIDFEGTGSINLTISIKDGLLNVTPRVNWFGTEIIKITASDGELTNFINVTIIVISVNDAPYDVNIFAESSYIEGEDQIVNSTAIDVDIQYGDDLTFSWQSNISGEIGEGRSINLSLHAGHHLITLTVTDIEGLSSQATMEIEIIPKVVPDDDDTDDDTNDDDTDGIEEKGMKSSTILIIVGAIVLILIVILVIVFLFMKKKPDGQFNEGMEVESMDTTEKIEEQVPVDIKQPENDATVRYTNEQTYSDMGGSESFIANDMDSTVQYPIDEEINPEDVYNPTKPTIYQEINQGKG